MARTWEYGEDGYQAITFEYVPGGYINIFAAGYEGRTEISRMPFEQLSEMYGAMLHFQMAEEFSGMQRRPCAWPACLNPEQQALLAEETRREELTGEPSALYAQRYPYDQRLVCGCQDPAGEGA